MRFLESKISERIEQRPPDSFYDSFRFGNGYYSVRKDRRYEPVGMNEFVSV